LPLDVAERALARLAAFVEKATRPRGTGGAAQLSLLNELAMTELQGRVSNPPLQTSSRHASLLRA
jgi:hypothetical protein